MDLASLESIAKFAADFKALNIPLHILVLNAGIMKSPGATFIGQDERLGKAGAR